MYQHEIQQIIIYLNKQFSRVLFPCENQGVTNYNIIIKIILKFGQNKKNDMKTYICP
jgi:hypothetical protein